MKTIFLEVNDKNNKIKKITYKDNKIFINRNINNIKKRIKISQKIKKVLERDNIRQLVIEKELKCDSQFMNLLYSNNINICDSKWVLKQYTDELISKVLKDKKREEAEISICLNEVEFLSQKYIQKFAKEFKRVNIITNHIGKFKKIEEKLYNEDGIILNITNNRKKGLTKSDIILNVDFPKELLNEFIIFDKSIIINWDEHLKIRKKRFDGKIIEEINIKINEDSEIRRFIEQNNLQNYDERDICQVLGTISNTEIIIS